MKYKLLDLFCGACGLSLGFERAGFSVVKAVDIDPWSVSTYNHNRKNKVAEVMNVTSLTSDYLNSLGTIDGIIGGPPCQGFSTAGQRIIDDDRNKLYREYFRILEEVRPIFFILENVTGMLNFSKGLVKEDILRRAKALGYNVNFKVLNTSAFGIPQFIRIVLFSALLIRTCNQFALISEFLFPQGYRHM